MTLHSAFSCIAISTLVVSLAVAAPALAQQTGGVTSGPAAGTPVVPSTTAQKQNPANPAGSVQSNDAGAQGAAGAGAPGGAAKSGSEGGPSPGPGSGKRP